MDWLIISLISLIWLAGAAVALMSAVALFRAGEAERDAAVRGYDPHEDARRSYDVAIEGLREKRK